MLMVVIATARSKRALVMGSEVEYSVSGQANGQRVETEHVCNVLLDMLRRAHAWLPQHCGNGFFAENGFHCYAEINGHLELASPEVSNPRQIALYDQVGERMLCDAVVRARAAHSLDVTVCKHNAGAVFDTVSFGHHESYRSFVPADIVAKVILSHLATRSLYAGSGCFRNHRDGVYSLSQRAQFIRAGVSSITEGERPLLCTRVRKSIDRGVLPEAGTWWRAHILCGDSHRLPFATYLTFGTTGLVFEMLNRGWKFRRLPRLLRPVHAFHRGALDPYFHRRFALHGGGRATALEIQSAYCAEAERFVDRADGPDWGAELVHHWRETLDIAARDPLCLAPRLDAYRKLHMLQRQIDRAGLDWMLVHRAWRRLHELRMICSDKVVMALFDGSSDGLNKDEQSQWKKAKDLLADIPDLTLDHIRFVVRLQALQVQYHVLGGWYDQSARDGLAEPVAFSNAEIEAALHTAPTGTRAEARGRYIRHLQDERDQWYCNWDGLRHTSLPKRIDLRDPLDTRGTETESGEDNPGMTLRDFLF
jgi:hypothetical protein